jgi:RimJ/RimL family protein N-acetyltransferase
VGGAPPPPIRFPVEGLSDGVVLLRLPAEADVPALVEACQDPAVRRYTTVPSPYRPEHAREFMRMSEGGAAGGLEIHLVTVDAESGEVLGTIGTRRHGSDAGCWDIGYLLAPAARGRGAATRAVLLLARFAFDSLGAERIEIIVEPGNEASLRVAERAGFSREGVLRRYRPVRDVRRDMVMYSLLLGELG